MVKIIVNKGRKVWDRENRREAKEGETVEVKDIEATILKFRGAASDAPSEPPPVTQPKPPAEPPAPPPPPPPPPPEVPAAAAEVPVAEASSRLVETPAADEDTRRNRIYRRRDLRSEN